MEKDRFEEIDISEIPGRGKHTRMAKADLQNFNRRNLKAVKLRFDNPKQAKSRYNAMKGLIRVKKAPQNIDVSIRGNIIFIWRTG